MDMVEVFRALHEVKFDGFLIDDHVPHMVDDTEWGHRGRAHAVWLSPGHGRGSDAPRLEAKGGIWMAAIPAPLSRNRAVPFYRRPYVGYAFRLSSSS